MSNQNLPKLFFFNIEPWKEVYNDRFLLKQLQEKGFPIEYVWIGPLVGLLSNVPSKGCETIPKSWKVILLLFEWLSYDIPHATSFSPLCATTEIISSSLAISTFSFSNGFK